VLIAGVSASLGAALLAAALLPALLPRLVCEPYGAHCTIGRAWLQPRLTRSPRLIIHDLAILEPNRRDVLLRVKRLAVGIDLLALIRGRGATLADVQLDAPDLRLRRLDDGRWNLTALAATIREHLRPTARAATRPLPRVVLTGATIRGTGIDISRLALTVEPKPPPRLLEFGAHGQIGAASLAVEGFVHAALDGEVRIDAGPISLKGATAPWQPRGWARFQLDLAKRQLEIAAWTIEEAGLTMRGNGSIRYDAPEPAFTFDVGPWRLDLATTASKLPVISGFALAGEVRGAPFALAGPWAHPVLSSVTATLHAVSLRAPSGAFGVSDLEGRCQARYSGDGIRLEASLWGDAIRLFGRAYAAPRLGARLTIDPHSGRVVLHRVRATMPGLRVRAEGSARSWGRGGLQIRTTDLAVDPRLLRQIAAVGRVGRAIAEIERPSIRVTWGGTGSPWTVRATVRALAVGLPGPLASAGIREADLTVEAPGRAPGALEGTFASRQVEVAGRALSGLTARFVVHPDLILIEGFRAAVAEGAMHGSATVSMPSALRSSTIALTLSRVRVSHLLGGARTIGPSTDLTLDAGLSVALARGQVRGAIEFPPTVTSQLARLVPRLVAAARTGAQSDERPLALRLEGRLSNGDRLEGSGLITLHGLRSLLRAGEDRWPERPVAVSFAYRNRRLSFKTDGVAFSATELSPILSAIAGRALVGAAGTVAVAAQASVIGAARPAVTGTVTVNGVALDLARPDGTTRPLLRGVRGTVPFALDQESLILDETWLRADGGLAIALHGAVPLRRPRAGATRFRLELPWSDVSAIRTPLLALLPDRLGRPRLSGRVRAEVSLTASRYRAVVELRGVDLDSDLVHVQDMSGSIPLAGPIAREEQPHGRVPVGGGDLGPVSGEAYERARTALLGPRLPEQPAPSLTIASLRYGPMELRNIQAWLATDAGSLAIRRFRVSLWDGKGGGWGALEPLLGRFSLALVVEELSLQAICDAFPPIRGYIRGRINGLAWIRLHGSAIERAEGRARVWSIPSRRERRVISRTLIEKLAGRQIRYFNLFGDDRRYDRGALDVSLRRGDLIFHELNISHATLGIKDLDVNVSPTFNTISATHLAGAIVEAIERITASRAPGS